MDDEEELDFFKMAPTTTERDNEGASSTLKELEYEYARGLITHGPILEHINDRSFMDIRTSEDSKEVISISKIQYIQTSFLFMYMILKATLRLVPLCQAARSGGNLDQSSKPRKGDKLTIQLLKQHI